ncbi:TRIM71 [Mytilus coruscus]|uniref:TRIM71 n=1 Tax=Mytilus coruscus TaxID=42192 RepID=A0A6J8B8M3_MYTCO|nr:TRIM71 [Mytilus coruscus]
MLPRVLLSLLRPATFPSSRTSNSMSFTHALCESLTYITWKGNDRLEDYKFFDHSKNEQYKSQCQICDKSNMAASKCEDCQEFMCKECNDYHKTHYKFKSHSIVSIDSTEKEIVSKAGACTQVATIEKMCQVHYKYCRPMEEFCKSCSIPVCSVCMTGFHKGHETEPLQTTVARARTSLSAASRALKSRIPFK